MQDMPFTHQSPEVGDLATWQENTNAWEEEDAVWQEVVRRQQKTADRKESSRTTKEENGKGSTAANEEEKPKLVWQFHNKWSSNIIVPAGDIRAPQPKQYLYRFRSTFRTQTYHLILMHLSIIQGTRIHPKHLELLETKTYKNKKALWDNIFFNML